MDRAELKARFDREISAPAKKLLWEQLDEERYVSEMCQGESDWPEFEARARRLADYQRKMLGRTKPSGRTPCPSFVDVGLTSLEKKHAAALAPYLAKRAALLQEVQDFRNERLGGTTLYPDQVIPFLRSQFGYLSASEREELDFALEQVPSYLDGNEMEELMDLVGGWKNRGLESERRYWYENFRRAAEADSMATNYLPSEQALYGLMHLIRDRTGRTLEDLGRLLLSHYPWSLRDAAWFVLTDEPPEIESLKIHASRTDGAYGLTFAPWISERTIRLAYRSLQSGDNRPLRDKSLSAFRFVDKHTAPGQTPKWADLTRRWNEQHPGDRFTDRSALRRAYVRAEKRLVSA